MIERYNNSIILTINGKEPIKDNNLRNYYQDNTISTFYECQDYCQGDPVCEHFTFNDSNAKCILYRKEPFNETYTDNIEQCKDLCYKNESCDYTVYNSIGKCSLFSRENRQGKTSINGLWTDYPIYGYDNGNTVNAEDFNECREKMKEDFVFYEDEKKCVAKNFLTSSPGSTTIVFDKRPTEEYKKINDYIGYKSEDREKIGNYKTYFLIIVIVVLFYLFFFIGYLLK
jgi:hypothetical protein